jgi:hypothetical protein
VHQSSLQLEGCADSRFRDMRDFSHASPAGPATLRGLVVKATQPLCVTDQPMGTDISSLNGAALCNGSEEVFIFYLVCLFFVQLKTHLDKWNYFSSRFNSYNRVGIFVLLLHHATNFILITLSREFLHEAITCLKKLQF